MPQTGTTGLRVENCTFNNIYYAGYFQAAGELINNKMVNTRAAAFNAGIQTIL